MRAPGLSARLPVAAWAAEVVHDWTWRHTALGLGLGLLSAVQSGMLTIGAAAAFDGLDPIRGHLLWWLYHACQFGLPIVFAVCIADRAVDQGARQLEAYGMAVAATLLLGGWAGNVLVGMADPRKAVSLVPPVWIMLAMAPLLGLGTAAYADWRHERQMCARARAREIQRARQQQCARSAQLLALQARVEPQLLFETMKGVEALLATSPADADRRLADLIALLRAMLPLGGATATTLGREVALVESYGRVVQTPMLQSPALQWSIAADAAPAMLAPMVLLPVLKNLVAAGATGLRVSAQREAERLRLRIAVTSAPGKATPAITLDVEALRERLAAVHGDSARVDLEPGPTTILDITLPFQHDDSTHR